MRFSLTSESSAKGGDFRSQLLSDLREQCVENFAAMRLFDAVPVIFPDPSSCTKWKVRVANLLSVDPCSVYVIGSACTYVSFNPNKNFKLFDAKSDVDIAVISGYHFEIAWRAVRDIGAGKYRLDPAGQAALQEHRESHVYWGMFATDKLLSALPFGKEWTRAAIQLSSEDPMRGRDIKFRLYRDSFSFVGYHLNGLGKLRRQLLQKTN